MITNEEVHVIDINSEFYGVTTLRLMENAGRKVAEFIIEDLNLNNRNIILFCGTGNNGGDGFVAGRYLSKKNNITIFLVGLKNDIKTDISLKNFKRLHQLKSRIKIFDIKDAYKVDELIEKNDIVVDSMLGIGLSGDLREPYYGIVKKINNSKNKIVISVDIPTGLGTNIYITPNYTITFHDEKNGMNNKNCGKINVVDIGIPKKAVEFIGPGEIKTYYPIPKKDSHKGDNGTLLIVGGGPYYGAPALSSFAAQRTGIDLVYIATPKKVAKAITSYSPLLIKPLRLAKKIAVISPTLIVKELNHENKVVKEDIGIIKELMSKSDALLIGPGLGSDPDADISVHSIIKLFLENKKPIVIDADAIKIIGKNVDMIQNSNTVVTPHSREFKDLTGICLDDDLESRINKVEEQAKRLKITIVLKGPVDIISNGYKTRLNDFHNEAMTVGGSGDVLAGIIASFLARNVESFNAARMGVFINGAAGNLAFNKKSFGLIATDIIEEIPNVLRKILI
jgi:NAD(P)H-hydrate epimerase